VAVRFHSKAAAVEVRELSEQIHLFQVMVEMV
jgi:hypothetical protein